MHRDNTTELLVRDDSLFSKRCLTLRVGEDTVSNADQRIVQIILIALPLGSEHGIARRLHRFVHEIEGDILRQIDLDRAVPYEPVHRLFCRPSIHEEIAALVCDQHEIEGVRGADLCKGLEACEADRVRHEILGEFVPHK